jgi:hypothetical protein
MGSVKRVHLWRGCITGFGRGQSAELVETDDDAERNNQRSKELEKQKAVERAACLRAGDGGFEEAATHLTL